MYIEDVIEKIPTELQPLFAGMHNEIQRLTRKLHDLNRQLYGAKSERFVSLPLIEPKGALFNEAELENSEPTEDKKRNPQASSGKKKSTRSPESGGRQPLPTNLPRTQILHDVPEEQKICPADLSPLQKIGEDVIEKLDFIPAQFVVQQHVYPKYACPLCEGGITRAPATPCLLPHSQVEAGLLAEVILDKYFLGLPLYRQEAIFAQMGLGLSRTSLARWVIHAAEALEPLISLIKSHLLAQEVIHGDETTVQVLKGTGKKPQSKCYMWTLCSSQLGDSAIWFEFHSSRSQEAAEALLSGFQGLLHVDGYDGYNSIADLPTITRVGCWAHARRNFERNLAEGAKKGATLSEQFILLIQKLFLLERDWKDLAAKERLAQRVVHSSPVVENIRLLLDEHTDKVPPKSKIASAMGYLANDWNSFTVFLKDGRAELSNNRMENFIRPFAIGRKNWLFSDTVAGARASALLYSLIVTAKANQLDLRQYLTHVINSVPLVLREPNDDKRQSQLKELLPWNWKPPSG